MRKALALAALLLLPLVPGAEALGAAPQPWSPYNAVSEVAAIAMAREGPTVAAALRAPTTPTPNPGTVTPPGVPGLPCATSGASNAICTDLAILDFSAGLARNGTTLDQTPSGRTHVAVSRDGSAVATWGIDAPPAEADARRLTYYRATSGNWSAAIYERSIAVGAPAAAVPLGLALSDDGRRLVGLTIEGGSYVLRGYVFTGSALDNAFTVSVAGTPRALAASGDLSRIVVAGQFVEGNFTYGGAHVRGFDGGEPTATFLDRSANNTDVTAAAISRAGDVVALGGNSTAWIFRDGPLAVPANLTVGTGPVGLIAMSDDGGRVAVATNLTLTLVDARAATALWNTTVPGATVTGLSLNRTGELLLVATGGTGGAVLAYDEAEGTPLWTIPGDTRGVVVDADGTRIAYAQRSAISAAGLPRALTLELASGGKLAPTREIALPGNVSYELVLRNDGATAERVVFEESSPELGLRLATPVVVVPPGVPTRVNLTLEAEQPLPGPRVLNVTARALSSGLVDNVTLSLAPKPTLDVKLFANRSEVIAEPGRTSEVLLTIYNNGTSDAPVAVRAMQTVSAGPLWELQLDQDSFTALQGTVSTVKVRITPPLAVENGTSSTVVFTLEGRDIFDTARVTFRVNPELEVVVNATGVTKFIEPGRTARYNVTVTNTGSLPRDFEVFYTITESSGRSWGVDMVADTVRLDPQQRRVFAVSIVAPADAQPNERVSVLVTARSIPEQVNETQVIDNVTLFGVAIPPKVTTTTTPTNGIPFVAPLAVVLFTFLAAALRRRRGE